MKNTAPHFVSLSHDSLYTVLLCVSLIVSEGHVKTAYGSDIFTITRHCSFHIQSLGEIRTQPLFIARPLSVDGIWTELGQHPRWQDSAPPISGYWPTSEPNAGYSDAMTSRLPRYEAKCVQRRYFQWGSVPLRSDIKGTELPPANILIYHSKGNWLRYNLPLTVFI